MLCEKSVMGRGREYARVTKVTHNCRVVTEALSDVVTIEEKSKGRQGTSHVDI